MASLFSSSSSKSLESVRQPSSNSLMAAARASSTFSYQEIKNLAALAVDVMAPGAEASKPTKGDIFENLKSEMGDNMFNDLCADKELAVVKVSYCQRQLRQLENLKLSKSNFIEASGKTDLSDAAVEEANKVLKWGVVNHDFLVLELQPGNRKYDKFFILAEKLYSGTNKRAGIFIKYQTAEEIQFYLTDKTVSHSIECGKQILLEELLKILKSVDPDYCLRDTNCWDYAIRVEKKLLRVLADDPKTSEEEKARIRLERQNLEANLVTKGMKNLWEKVKDYTSKGSSAIARQFRS